MRDKHHNRTTTSKPRVKPRKPFPAFPLTPHASGQWVKKINGKLHYFGVWADPDSALENYHARAKELHGGSIERASPDSVTVKDVANRFLNHVADQRERGAIVASWAGAYERITMGFVGFVKGTTAVADLTPDHFTGYLASLASGRDKSVQCIRTLFATAADQGWCNPVRFGKQFRKTPRAITRLTRRPLLFTPAECQAIVAKASGQMLAMVLLGLNGGMGQSDVAGLTVGDIDVEHSVIEHRRQKTNVPRMIPLWRQTMDALRPHLADKSASDLVFLTRHGKPWVREQASVKSPDKVTTVDSVSLRFGELLAECGIRKRSRGGRPVSDGRGFYTLRRVFRTAADDQGDQRAIALIMGHAPGSSDMGAVYVQRIERARLDAVVNHVRTVLFSEPSHKTSQAPQPCPA